MGYSLSPASSQVQSAEVRPVPGGGEEIGEGVLPVGGALPDPLAAGIVGHRYLYGLPGRKIYRMRN